MHLHWIFFFLYEFQFLLLIALGISACLVAPSLVKDAMEPTGCLTDCSYYRGSLKPKPSENRTWLCQQVVFLNGTDVGLNMNGYREMATDIKCGVGYFSKPSRTSVFSASQADHRCIVVWSFAETQLFLSSVVLLRKSCGGDSMECTVDRVLPSDQN